MRSHILLNFIPRQDRPYHGILQTLAHDPDASVQIIDLPEALFELTRRVEYSLRKYVRFLYYGAIYRYLEEAVGQAINAHSGVVFVYTTDEGVWTEYMKQILKRHAARRPVLLNVQHGLHFLESPGKASVLIRRAANALCRLTVGYPIFGFGMGGSQCDLYLVYGEPERAFLTAMGLKAEVASRLIKARFLEQVALATPAQGPDKVALFALQPVSKEAGFARTESDFYNVLRPVAERLARQHGYRVIFRPHPGMDHHATLTSLERAGLLEYGEMQNVADTDVTQALARAEMVLSHSSTVLLEAMLADRISVQLLEYNDSKRMHLPINFLCLEGPEAVTQTDAAASEPIRVRQSPSRLGTDNWVGYLNQAWHQ